ncbi:MAG: putative ABC transporter permease subunit [Dehalococcoidia bacterium]
MIQLIDEFLILLRLQLRLAGRRGTGGRGGRPQGGSRQILLRFGALGLFGFAVSFSLGGLLSGVVSGSAGRSILAPLLTWASSWAGLLIFLFAVPLTLGAFTIKSDLNLLLLTPLSPRLILAEKLAALYATLALPILVGGLLILSAIGSTLSLGLGYYLSAVPILVLLPVVPLSLAAVITALVLPWIPPARARTVTALLGALLGIGIYLSFQLLNGGSSGSTRTAALQSSLAHTSGSWWSNQPAAWPGAALAAAGLGQTGTALSYFVPMAILAAFLAVLAVILSAHLFASGWATYQEVGRRSRRTTARNPTPAVAIGNRQSAIGARPHPASRVPRAASRPKPETRNPPPWWPLVGKEWRSFCRDPQIWTQLLYPFFIAGFSFYRTILRATSSSGGASITTTGLYYGTLAFMTYLWTATLSLPLFNREGRSLRLLALLPLTTRQILLAKWMFCAAPGLIIVELLAGLSVPVLAVSPFTALLAAASFAGLIVALSGTLLLISLIWPRLDWDNPRRQVSTTASLVGGIGGLALVALVAGLLILTLVLAGRRSRLTPVTAAAIFLLIGLAIAIVAVEAPARLGALLQETMG